MSRIAATPELLGIPLELRIEVFKQLLDVQDFTDFRSLSLLNKQAHIEVEDVLLKNYILTHVRIDAEEHFVDGLLSGYPPCRVVTRADGATKLSSLKYAHAKLDVTAAVHSRKKVGEAVLVETADEVIGEMSLLLRSIPVVDLPPVTPETIRNFPRKLVTLRHATFKLNFKAASPYTALHEIPLLRIINVYCRDFRAFSITGAKDTALAQKIERAVKSARWPSLQHFCKVVLAGTENMTSMMAARDQNPQSTSRSLNSFGFLIESTFTSDQAMSWAHSTVKVDFGLSRPLATFKRTEHSMYFGTIYTGYMQVMSNLSELFLRQVDSIGSDDHALRKRLIERAVQCAQLAVNADTNPRSTLTEYFDEVLAQVYCRYARAKELLGDLKVARTAARRALEIFRNEETLEHALRIERSWRAAESPRSA